MELSFKIATIDVWFDYGASANVCWCPRLEQAILTLCTKFPEEIFVLLAIITRR